MKTSLLLLALAGVLTTAYGQPLQVATPDGTAVESCADPVVFRGEREHAANWYMYCTTDPLHGKDLTPEGKPRFRQVPMFVSTDLQHWTYAGDALPSRPDWAAPGAGLWAPDVRFIGGRYVMYVGVTDVIDSVSGQAGCDTDSAIGVATSSGPLGPWQFSAQPVIAPRRAGAGCAFYWTYDPRYVAGQDGKGYLYFGSYSGGMFVQPLAADAMSASGAPVRIAVDGRYEAAEVIYRDGYYYLFASASNCCNGALTGYGVYVARSVHPSGPFIDAQGQSLLAAKVGGTPLLAQIGDRWVGPGHNTVFADAAGQWWTVYHAIDRHQPYLDPGHTLNRRPVLRAPIAWGADGWPVIGTPARQARELSTLWTDNFAQSLLHPRWQWVREPAGDSYALRKGTLNINTRKSDLYAGRNDASVLTALAPEGDFVVQASLRLDFPAQGCCSDPVQAGLALYGGDDDYVKLVQVALGATRQLELALEVPAAANNDPRYGNTVLGAPGELTWLRLEVRRGAGGQGEDQVTGSSSLDGRTWIRGATWTLPAAARRIALLAMGGEGGTARFGQVRVARIAPR